MNFFDLLVILLVIGLGISGYREGLLREAVKLAGFIITILVLAVFSDRIIHWAHDFRFMSPKIAVPLAFIIILISGLVAFSILAGILHKLVHMTPVGFIDSGLGSAFGVLKALLLGGVIAIMLSMTPPGSFLKGQFGTSRTAGPLVQLLSESIPFVKKTVNSLYRLFPSLPEIPEKENHEDVEHDLII